MIGRRLRRAGVLGLNSRNASYIMRYNPRRRYPLVDNKILCKQVLSEAGMPVPDMIGAIRSMRASNLLEERLHGLTEFVIKPANGSGGDGILVITSKRNEMYIGTDGHPHELADLEHHLTNIVSGLYSLGGQPDQAMLESLVRLDDRFAPLSYRGIPDIRVIVFKGFPTMAMVRLPTRRSHGKANLHQGAIGAGISIASGLTVGGVQGNHRVSEHPDTGAPVAGFPVPHWERILELSAACRDAVKLDYLGVDIVLDRDRGPLILELNARPGLNIQIANGQGLAGRLRWVRSKAPEGLDPIARVAWAQRRFDGDSPRDGDPRRQQLPLSVF